METPASLKEDAARYRRLLSMGVTDEAAVAALREMAEFCEAKAEDLARQRAQEPKSFE